MALEFESVVLCYRFLQDVDGRIAEFDLYAAARADEVIMVLPPPDVFIPCPPGSRIFLNAGPPDHPRFDEQCKVPVYGDERERIALFPKELHEVVGMEMSLYIASCFQ